MDPITLAVVRGSLEQIADEMDATLERMAFSPVISDGFDRASGIYAAHDGAVIVQGPRGLPNFICVMQHTVRSAIAHFNEPADGDVYIVNDPYLGGTHLMDVKLIRPFFYGNKLAFFLANSGHWPDIGGRVPGGFSTKATEVFQEGLRLPPVKLMDKGRLNQEVVDIILHNVRVPDERRGDIIAQVASLSLGADRLTALLDRYGETTVFEVVDELELRSERLMRKHISTIPDGRYTFDEYMDSDGVDWKPLHIHLEMTVDGDSVHIDLSGSSPACRGPLNSVLSTTMAGVYIAYKHFFTDVPINRGCFKPFSFNIPSTTFLHALPPRPVSGCAAEVCQRIIDSVLGAMSKALPDRCYAGPMGTVTNLSVGGDDPERGYFVFYSFIGGGYGGNYLTDGLTNGNPTIAVARTQALEIFVSGPIQNVRRSARTPVRRLPQGRVRRCARIPASTGRGQRFPPGRTGDDFDHLGYSAENRGNRAPTHPSRFAVRRTALRILPRMKASTWLKEIACVLKHPAVRVGTAHPSCGPRMLYSKT